MNDPRLCREPDALARGSVGWTLLMCVGLVALAAAVFGGTVEHEFVNYDDNAYVYANPAVRGGLSWPGVRWAFTEVHNGNRHPLTTLAHMLDCELFGLDAGRHHRTNVLLHAAVVVSTFLVLRRLTGALAASALVAALFAIHPLRVESVAWVSERKDLLSGLFFVLALGAHARYAARPSGSRYLAVLLLFALGLMSKPMVVTLPVVLLLVDIWPLGRAQAEPLRRLLLEKVPLLVLSALAVGVAYTAQGGAVTSLERISLGVRLSNALVSCATYLGQFFYPSGLAPFVPLDAAGPPAAKVLLSAAVLAGLTAFAFRERARRAWLWIGWLWTLVMLAPVIGLLQVGSQARADRYTYLPLIGFTLALAFGARELSIVRRFPRVAAGASIAWVLLLAAGARAQTARWRDSVSIWTWTVAHTEHNALAHHLLAAALSERGRPAESLPYYERALQLKPRSKVLHGALAQTLSQLGRFEEALRHHELALALDPDSVTARNNLAWFLATCPEDGLRDGRRALELAEQNVAASGKGDLALDAELFDTLAATLAENGDYEEAAAWTERAIALAPAASLAAFRERSALYRERRPFRSPRVASPE